MTRLTWGRGALAALAVALGAQSASACHSCKATPCVAPPPRPAYECVTEMVPYTVTVPRKRVEMVPYTKMVTVKERVTTYVPRQRVVCKPVFETSYVNRQRVVCKPVHETDFVTQTVTECRPVTNVRHVQDVCMQPQTRTVTVPVYAKSACGMGWLCGKLHGAHCGGMTPAGCQTVTQTCYVPVPVVREVVETRMVAETRTVQVPVRRTRYVQEVVNEQVPVKHCRMVQEVITEQVPVHQKVCVTKPVTCYRRVKVCEMVTETRYHKVKRMVPVADCGPVMGPVLPASQGGPYPALQGPASAWPASQARALSAKPSLLTAGLSAYYGADRHRIGD